MQKVRPTGFARPQAGQVGPVVGNDGVAAGGAAGNAAGLTATGVASGAGPGGGATTSGAGPGGGATTSGAGAVAASAANSRNAPQLPQNASPAAFDAPHFAQIIPLAFASIRQWFRAA
jgi:hypothetical protein